ncbi:MAG: hypothetical protein ACQEP9_05590 [Bacillota bacterium]
MTTINNPFLKDGKLAKNTSINRLKIIDIPGIDIDDEVKGKVGLELMSNDKLIEYIKKEAKRLELDVDEMARTELPIYLNQCFDSKNLGVRLTAENIAKRLGRNLGYILLVLKRGDKINQAAREDWNQEHWNYWQQIENIIFTGGLCNGDLGNRLKYYIEEVFAEANTENYKITIADEPSLVSIIGAARHVPRKYSSALVFDFGQTLIKRGLANYQGAELKEIDQFSSLKANHVGAREFATEAQEKREAEKLKDQIISVIKKTWEQVESKGFEPCPTISISIANNLVNGKFFGGGYGKLRLLADDFQELVATELSDLIGEKIEVSFIHDGTAAADAFAEVTDSVMLTLGTAIGVGFPIEKNDLRPLAENIKFK